MEKNNPKIIKRLRGVVVSDKMLKTVVVAVTRLKQDPKYKKQYKLTTKYKAHDEKGEYHTGDKVIIAECRPFSKDKRWRVMGKI
jgi:small subunit ribosomal protein S17